MRISDWSSDVCSSDLKILSHTPIAHLSPTSLAAVHYFSEAGKLAFADRDLYLADPDFVDVPVKGLLDDGYLALRAGLIKPQATIGRAPAGDPVGLKAIRGDRKSTRLNSSHYCASRMPSSA